MTDEPQDTQAAVAAAASAPRIGVVLLGASEFGAGFKPHAAFANAARDLRAYFDREFAALVLDLFDDGGNWLEQLARVREFVRDESIQVLFLFYVGHGTFVRMGVHEYYCLALRGSVKDDDYTTALPVPFLAEVVKRHAHAKTRYIVIDACFAAHALPAFQSGTHLARKFQAEFLQEHTGTALWAAASKDDFAQVIRDESSTYFCRALIDALTTGDAGSTANRLSVRDVARVVEESLLAANAPRPEFHVPSQRRGRVDEIPLFRNYGAEHARASAPSLPPVRRLSRRAAIVAGAAALTGVGGVSAWWLFGRAPTVTPVDPLELPPRQPEVRDAGSDTGPAAPIVRLHPGSSHDHYLALRAWPELAQAGRDLGTHLGDAYAEIWFQRFQAGLLIHPSRIEGWGAPPRDYAHGIWMLHADGVWLGHIRPPVDSVTERGVLVSMLRDRALRRRYAARISQRARWPARFDALTESILETQYRPHCEGEGPSIGGGIATAYVEYDLRRYLGDPIERNVVLVALFRAYVGGFVVAPLPGPSFRTSPGGEPRESILTDDGNCTVVADALDSIYVLDSTFSSHDDALDATHRAAGGDAWDVGNWRRRMGRRQLAPRRRRAARGGASCASGAWLLLIEPPTLLALPVNRPRG